MALVEVRCNQRVGIALHSGGGSTQPGQTRLQLVWYGRYPGGMSGRVVMDLRSVGHPIKAMYDRPRARGGTVDTPA